MTIQGFTKTGCTFRLDNPRTLRVMAGTVRDDIDGSTITVTEGTIDINTSGAGGLDTGSLAAGTYAVYSIDGAGVDEAKILSLAVTGSPTLPSGYTVWGFICYVDVVARSGGLYEFSGTFNDYESALGPAPMMMRALARMWATVVTAIGTADTFLGNVVGNLTGNVTGGVTGDVTGSASGNISKTVAGEIHAITAKATPVAADEILIEDSAASYAKKRATLSSLAIGAWVKLDSASPSASATVTFSSIPQTYDDLMIRYRGFAGSTGLQDLMIEFNGDTTASDYDRQQIIGANGAANADEFSNMLIGWLAGNNTLEGELGEGTIIIPNYRVPSLRRKARSTSTVITAADTQYVGTFFVSWVHATTYADAITQIVLRNSNNITGEFELYGIRYQ